MKIYALNFDGFWKQMFENVKKFIQENNRLPSSNFGKGFEEVTYSKWLDKNIESDNNGTLNEEQKLLLKSIGLKIKNNISVNKKDKEPILAPNGYYNFDRLLKFVKENKRYPKAVKRGVERGIYLWFLKNRKILSEEQKLELDSFLRPTTQKKKIPIIDRAYKGNKKFFG
jgi:hypothetical protein